MPCLDLFMDISFISLNRAAYFAGVPDEGGRGSPKKNFTCVGWWPPKSLYLPKVYLKVGEVHPPLLDRAAPREGNIPPLQMLLEHLLYFTYNTKL